MYSYSLRAAASSSTGLGFALGRVRGGGGGGGAVAGSGFAIPSRGRRSVSATSSASAPVPGEQGVSMEQPKQQQPQVPRQDAARGEKQDAGEVKQHDAHGDVMTHSFGEGYSTRSDEEGFGGVYGGNDPVENPGTEKIHPSHPEYDTSQGSEVKEKEKARHLKDDKHAT